MPRKYVRKQNIKPRAAWREEDLRTAINKIKSKELSINSASKRYNIPSRTLRRRLESNNLKKITLGKPPALGEDNEIRLVKHIKKLQISGFAPTPSVVRGMAYDFATKLNLEYKFYTNGKTNKTAGMHWFYSFMDRHPELSIRKSEGLSLARAKGMNREEVREFYILLKNTLEKFDLVDKPRSIYNMDESGIQINNKPGKVVAEKGSKCVHVLTSKERGENVSVIACANAEGTFLPPVLILKGVRKNMAVLEGMPPGSDLYMNKQSSFIKSDLFFKWLRDVFTPRKPEGPVILILDGHSSHYSNIEMLEFAKRNSIILLCLPSHTTQALQPLDRSFFKALKAYYKNDAETYMFTSKDKNINRNVIGKLIGPAWTKAATNSNAASGFAATGIYPYNQHIIRNYFYQIADNIQNTPFSHEPQIEENRNNIANLEGTQEENFLENDGNYLFLFNEDINNDKENTKNKTEITYIQNAIEITESVATDVNENNMTKLKPDEIVQLDKEKPGTSKNIEDTPSKFLEQVAPVPEISAQKSKRKQSAQILTSKRLKSKKSNESSNLNRKGNIASFNQKTKSGKNRNSEDDVKCVECLENYYETTERVDWIRCVECQKWLHESCTMYGNRCNICGRTHKRQEKAKKVTKAIIDL